MIVCWKIGNKYIVMKRKELTTRRKFIYKTGLVGAGVSMGAASFDAFSYSRIRGANDKIRMGFIGVGNRGSQLLKLFMDQPDVEAAALCDIYEPYLLRDRSKVDRRYLDVMPGQIPVMGEKFPKPPVLYRDYRKLLENKGIDAVCIATPDHWHALQVIDAIDAGKDIYVEKPLTATIVEGRKMVEAQARTGRVVAVGLNRRGNVVFQKLAKEIPAGKIGKVSVGRAARISNMAPDGIGKLKPENPPEGFNWDMWLGPAPYVPFDPFRCHYNFRWFWDYSGGQMTNWGAHNLDIARWALNARGPSAVAAFGGRYAINAATHFPDRVKAAASIYGTHLATDQPDSPHLAGQKTKAELYFACAETDIYAPQEIIDKVAAGVKGANAEVEVYPGTHHGFAFPKRPVYHRDAAERHWERLLALYKRNLSK